MYAMGSSMCRVLGVPLGQRQEKAGRKRSGRRRYRLRKEERDKIEMECV